MPIAWVVAAWLAGAVFVAEPAGAQERRIIQDPRLEADSTLFPYEWPAFEGLMARLVRLRPALEAVDLRDLASALPEVRAEVDTLLADSIPSLLARRTTELRGRMIELRDAVHQAGELADSAFAAPQPDSAAVATGGGWSGGFPVTLGPAGEVRGDNEIRAVEPYDPAGWPAAADADTSLSGAASDSAAALDPIESFLGAWRDVYANAEAIVHGARDP